MRALINTIKLNTFSIGNDGVRSGTCFKVSGSDIFITCAHVISDAHGGLLKDLKIIASDNIFHDFKVLKYDRGIDIALLKCDQLSHVPGLQLGDYEDVEEGDEILLCGFPFGYKYHVTHRGMVSAKAIINGRQSIQVDASVNKGNSGGPCLLLNSGEAVVVGVIATRLVGANLEEFYKQRKELANGLKTITTHTANGIANITLLLMNLFWPILNELDRFINVGFGEAISINYAKTAIDHIGSNQSTVSD